MTVATLSPAAGRIVRSPPRLLVHSGHGAPPGRPPAPPATADGSGNAPLFFISYFDLDTRSVCVQWLVDFVGDFTFFTETVREAVPERPEWEPLFRMPGSAIWPNPHLLARLPEQAPSLGVPGVLAAPQARFSVASRASRRRVMTGAAFAMALAACADASLNFGEAAQFINQATGIDPWMIAVAVSVLTGIAFDKLYPPDKPG
ncbi:hypothetical protein [Sphaerisporangium rhizosphaerae]|uniref:TIR domain-containing protein n=1 Tax=Sphaerisporangium rhizosphaerae TaxID=2269375 RepID=A0ABW2PAS9_9ACTN